jgi:hypothetical protein
MLFALLAAGSTRHEGVCVALAMRSMPRGPVASGSNSAVALEGEGSGISLNLSKPARLQLSACNSQAPVG